MKEADRMIKQMELELTTGNSIDIKSKNSFQIYKKKIDDMKAKYFKIKENFTYTKKMEDMIIQNKTEEINNINNNNINNANESQAQLHVENNSLIASNSDDKLQRAKRSALEIENMSKNVMVDLEGQTQKLNSTNSKLSMMNGSLDNSSSIMTRMMNRENRNKALVGVFSVTLATFFIFVLCSKLG